MLKNLAHMTTYTGNLQWCNLNVFASLHMYGQVTLKFDFTYDKRMYISFVLHLYLVFFFFFFFFSVLSLLCSLHWRPNLNYLGVKLYKSHAQKYILPFQNGSPDKIISQSNTCDEKLITRKM